MTTAHLADDIEAEEGRRNAAYPDPLTGGAPWTIGVGHTGPDIHKGLTWNDAQIDAQLSTDIQRVCDGLDRAIPWWRSISDERQDVLVQMAFQMGVSGLLAFHNTLANVKAGRFDLASIGMLASAWATQTPERADRLATQMKTGARP